MVKVSLFTQKEGHESSTTLVATKLTVGEGVVTVANSTPVLVSTFETRTITITNGVTNTCTVPIGVGSTATNVEVAVGDSTSDVTGKIAALLTVSG
jgi:hypothetical protein